MKPLLTTVSFQNTLSLLDSFFYPFTPYLKSIFLRIFKKSEEIKTTSRKGIQDMLLVKFFSVDWLPSHSLYDLVLRYGVKKCRLGKIKKLVKTWQFFSANFPERGKNTKWKSRSVFSQTTIIQLDMIVFPPYTHQTISFKVKTITHSIQFYFQF